MPGAHITLPAIEREGKPGTPAYAAAKAAILNGGSVLSAVAEFAQSLPAFASAELVYVIQNLDAKATDDLTQGLDYAFRNDHALVVDWIPGEDMVAWDAKDGVVRFTIFTPMPDLSKLSTGAFPAAMTAGN